MTNYYLNQWWINAIPTHWYIYAPLGLSELKLESRDVQQHFVRDLVSDKRNTTNTCLWRAQRCLHTNWWPTCRSLSLSKQLLFVIDKRNFCLTDCSHLVPGRGCWSMMHISKMVNWSIKKHYGNSVIFIHTVFTSSLYSLWHFISTVCCDENTTRHTKHIQVSWLDIKNGLWFIFPFDNDNRM